MPSPTNPCPNVNLGNICGGPTDEVLGYNCMALASSPCSSGNDPFGESAITSGSNPGSSGLPVDSSSESSSLQGGLETFLPELSTGQWLSIPFIIIGIIFLILKNKRTVI